MEGASSKAKKSPAMPPSRSTIEEKLFMTSPNNTPNNNRSMIDPQIVVSPHSRRGKIPKKSRRRSFESIGVSGFLPRGSIGDDNLKNNRGDEKSPMISPSNSNDSLSRNDTIKSIASLRSARSLTRSVRSKNPKLPHPRSFDSIELARSLLCGSNDKHWEKSNGNSMEPLPSEDNSSLHGSDHQESLSTPRSVRQNNQNSRRRNADTNNFSPPLSRCDDNDNNDKNTITDKLSMTSPNNNLNKNDNQIFTSSRQKVQNRRQRIRRKSFDASNILIDFPLQALEKGNNRNHDESGKSSVDAFENASGQKQFPRQDGGMRSLPSNSGHSRQSDWTEMTIHTDTYLHPNQDDECSSSGSSAYYSDLGLPFETFEPSNSSIMKGYGFEEEDDDDDDSSNPNFNYMARDNGSLKTLSSAFSLNDMGSTGTISSLSVDGAESDPNLCNFPETPDKQIQFATFSNRQLRRQPRRNSSHSFGRRLRRGSFGSFSSIAKSGDEVTEEEEVTTLDLSIPTLPNLPNRLSASQFLMKRIHSESGDELADNTEDVEEVTVDEAQTDDDDVEYLEELLNDHSGHHDDSTKRYEIIISDDSFVEEIVVEVEEEEITLEDDCLNNADIDEVELNSDSHHIEYDDQNIDDNSDCYNYNGCPNGQADPDSSISSKNKPSDAADNSEDNVGQRSNGDQRISPNIGNKSGSAGDIYCKTETAPTGDEQYHGTMNSEYNGGTNDAPETIQEGLELSKNCRKDEANKNLPQDDAITPECRMGSQNHDSTDVSPEMNSNSGRSHPKGDDKCSPAKTYRDVLMGSKA